MARQIPCLDSPMPPARNQKQCGNEENRKDSPSGKTPIRREFSFIRSKIFSQAQTSLRHSTSARNFCTLHRAAFYYFLLATDADIANWMKDRCSIVGRSMLRPYSATPGDRVKVRNNDGNYLEAWFSPRRFKRSRKRRCSGVGVLGLNATRYQSGWLRSLLSQASVCGSELGCRATFSRIAP